MAWVIRLPVSLVPSPYGSSLYVPVFPFISLHLSLFLFIPGMSWGCFFHQSDKISPGIPMHRGDPFSLMAVSVDFESLT